MRIQRILASLALATTVATPALADDDGGRCGNAPRAQWMSEDAAKGKATELGYQVRQVKEEEGCYEVYAIDKNGAKVELHMDPVSGTVVKSGGES
jgi:hypothetical protein